jgi:hypothetical protein
MAKCALAMSVWNDRMEYKVGSRVRFRLYIGREVDGVIRAILKTTSGTRLRMGWNTELDPTLLPLTLSRLSSRKSQTLRRTLSFRGLR